MIIFTKWLLISFGSYFSIEVQGLIIHGAQPGIIYSIVYGAYAIQKKFQIGIYTLGNILFIALNLKILTILTL